MWLGHKRGQEASSRVVAVGDSGCEWEKRQIEKRRK